MKESQFIGTLMPSHPNLQPIIQELREKYQLSELGPDGEPINSSNQETLDLLGKSPGAHLPRVWSLTMPGSTGVALPCRLATT